MYKGEAGGRMRILVNTNTEGWNPAAALRHKRSSSPQSPSCSAISMPAMLYRDISVPTLLLCLFENAHLTLLFSTRPSIVHCARRGRDGKQAPRLVSLFSRRFVLAINGEMECTQFHRRRRSHQDKSACARMPRPQLQRSGLQQSEEGMAKPRSSVRTHI
jgi:hypothetical protein